jgi:hypothetical protein
VAAGRACFRPEDLLRLADLVEAMGSGRHREGQPSTSRKLRRHCKGKNAERDTDGSKKAKRTGQRKDATYGYNWRIDRCRDTERTKKKA